MNCKKCGNVLAPTDTFCKICGEPVTIESPNVAPAPNPAGMTFMASPAEPTNVPNSQMESQSVKQSTSNVIPNSVEPTSAPMPAVSINVPTEEIPAQDVMPINTTENINVHEPTPLVPNNGPVIPVTPINPSITPTNENLATPQGMPAQMNIQPNNVAPQPTVEPAEAVAPEKKKNSPVAVALLLIVLIAVIAYIVIFLTKPFDKNKNGNGENTSTENTTVEDQIETAQPAWMNYLLEQNITSITLERIPQDEEKKTATLTNDNLNDIFSKLANYQLIKKYYEGTGVADGDILTITYTKDDDNYEVKITNGMLWGDATSLKDEDLRNKLEESEHTTENEELKDKDGAFYNYVFSNYDNTLLDEYFVTEKIEETE